MPTREVNNGNAVTVQAAFRKYNTMAESVEDHANLFVVDKRYAHAMAVTNDPNAFAQEIQRAGYATDPNYANLLISLMQQHHLYQYDAKTVQMAA
jgi:flagellum-specific peptidoglycan hydrolase FlgJ